MVEETETAGKEAGTKTDKPKSENGILYIGMDLGSFKTSIAASNGSRETVLSAVGWPKDPVAEKMLGGRKAIYGNEAIEKRLALKLIRPFGKGVLKYMDAKDNGLTKEMVDKHKEAATLLVKHAAKLARAPRGTLVYGVIGAPGRATVVNKEILLAVARETFDAVMIVSEPFAVAYGMNHLDDTLVIDIGAGTVDLCRMHGAIPTEEDQITLTTAGDYVDEEFCKRLKEKYPEAQFTVNMAREIKEKHGFVHDVNEKAEVTLPAEGRPKKFDVSEPLKEACKSMVQPIVQSLRRLIATFDPEFQRRMLSNILLAGGGSQLNGLDRLIEEALEEHGGGKVTRVPEPVYAGANGALKLSVDMPENYWKEFDN